MRTSNIRRKAAALGVGLVAVLSLTGPSTNAVAAPRGIAAGAMQIVTPESPLPKVGAVQAASSVA